MTRLPSGAIGGLLCAHDLLDAAMAQTDDLADVAVAESPRVGFADRGVPRLPGCLITGDGCSELFPWISHASKCTENLTRDGKTYRFLYMKTAEQTERKATYYHAMLSRNIPVTIRRTDKRGYVWIELPSGEVRRVKAMWVS